MFCRTDMLPTSNDVFLVIVEGKGFVYIPQSSMYFGIGIYSCCFLGPNHLVLMLKNKPKGKSFRVLKLKKLKNKIINHMLISTVLKNRLSLIQLSRITASSLSTVHVSNS